MILEPELLKKVKDSLPAGFGPVIREKLLLKGVKYTSVYIYKVMNPTDKRYNEEIVDTAVEYLKEINAEKKRSAKLVNSILS